MTARFYTLLLLLGLVACTRSAPPPEPISISPGQTYKQVFDDLADHGKNLIFPKEMLMGWWISRPTYSSSSGTEQVGVGAGIFSYGDVRSTERSLGSVNSNQLKHTSWGVAFKMAQNNQFTTSESESSGLWALKVSYAGEQWSVGGNESSEVVFDYSIVTEDDYMNGGAWGYYDNTSGLWMVKDLLSFTSPINDGDERALNGNDPSNRKHIQHTLAIDDWATGKIVQLRWTHDKIQTGRDHALAIDNLSVTLVGLREDPSLEPGHSLGHGSVWLYSGIAVAALLVAAIAAGLVTTLVIKRRRNQREGDHEFALLTTDPTDVGSTSINPSGSGYPDETGYGGGVWGH